MTHQLQSEGDPKVESKGNEKRPFYHNDSGENQGAGKTYV